MSRSGSEILVSLQEAATRSVQRRRGNSGLKSRLNLLWGIALFGLLLLPAEYRAGAETAHGHSLVQLWVDAADGAVDHGHDHHRAPDPAPAAATSWLEPLIGDVGNAGWAGLNDERPDVAEQHDSAPTVNGIHILLTMVTVSLALGARLTTAASCDRPIAGLSPRVVLPPPRWTPHAA